jgi:hypothetical protein
MRKSTPRRLAIFIDYGLLMIDYWVVGSKNDDVIAAYVGRYAASSQ